MPKQNRPLVRDGRIQGKKKRTDRSYLRPASAAPQVVAGPPEEVTAEEAPETAVSIAPPAETPAPRGGKLPTTVRAIQQQGVRKRREVDLQALARRDTQYALHELRRIAILATMVVVTLIVLGVVLR